MASYPGTARRAESGADYKSGIVSLVNAASYFELATFYDEFAKDWDKRRLPMRYQPHEDAIDVYRFWHERNSGKRQLPDIPTS